MRPMLDDLELPEVQEILIYDRRMLAEHKPPGLEGSYLQNMGRQPTSVMLWGIATGPDVPAFVETLNDSYRRGQPLPFVADIVADAEIENVLMENLQWREVAGKPDRYVYILALNEYLEPVEPETVTGLDETILADAQGLMEDLVAGLDLALPFSTGLERFANPLAAFLERLRQAEEDINQTS